jgi:hypothetical protein
MSNSGLKYLFGRRIQKAKWVFILGALPLLLFALMGWEYKAEYLYLPLAILCIIQYLFPTMITWIVLFCLYLMAAITYAYVFSRDLIKLLRGEISGASLFAGTEDTIFFTILIVIIIAITISLYKIRPKKYAI